MNHIKSLVFLVVAGLLQAAPSLTAQQQTFDAKVPFQFSAGDRTLPAGEYRISRHDAFLHVKNQNGHSAVVLLASAGDSFSDGQALLVFDHVNDQYFLRRVVAAQSVGSIELAVTRAEKKARLDQRNLSTANPPAAITQIVITGAQ
jgi:hypothetical protein